MINRLITLLFATVSSAAFFIEAQAAELIQSNDYEVVQQYKGAVPLPVIETERTVNKVAAIPVVDNLEELQKIIYGELLSLNTEIKVQYQGDTTILEEKIMGLLKGTFDSDDYLLGIVSGYGYSTEGYVNNITLTIKMDYTTTTEQEVYVKQEVSRLVEELITPSKSDVEKIKIINEYIVRNTNYSFDTETSPHAAYAILTEGKGVCQAYAMLAYMMLVEAGIEAHYVTGYVGEPHAWNLVKVDGEWYHLDTTWSDPSFSSSIASFPGISDYISYDYFLISDKVITQDHKVDERSDLPKATSERFSALRRSMSTTFIMNETPYVLIPEYLDGYLYYVDYLSGNYNINRIRLLAQTPVVESFADVRALDILSTANTIYFVDLDNQFGLSKIDLATKEVTVLHQANKINFIKKDKEKIYAYSNGMLVYTEPIEKNMSDVINEIEEMTSVIIYLNKNFASRAEQIFEKMEFLDNFSKQLLAKITIEKLIEIKSKYGKMNNLSFNQTIAWKEQPIATTPRKTWTITLSQDIKNTRENLENIHVVDMFGEPVDVKVTVVGNKIIVKANTDYVPEIPYTLVIETELENTHGDKLEKGTHMTFTFE